MINVLSPSFPENSSFTSFKALNHNILGREALMQKLVKLRKCVGTYEERFDSIKQEQKAMKHTAVVIRHDQEEIARKQEKLKKRQLVVAKNTLQVKHNHANIQHLGTRLFLTIKSLTCCIVDVYRNQRKVKKELVNIENEQLSIYQHLFIIHQNVSLIKQNIQHAKQKVRGIEKRIFQIQHTHESILMNVVDIEKKKDRICNHIPLLISRLHEKLYEKRDVLAKDKKITQIDSIDMLKRIQNFCLLIIATICERVFYAYQYMRS